jgi:ATP-dependent protease ClpP protease subunit
MQGMPIDSSVAELLTAQLFVLVQEAPDPIYFYINSTGIAVSGAAGRWDMAAADEQQHLTQPSQQEPLL